MRGPGVGLSPPLVVTSLVFRGFGLDPVRTPAFQGCYRWSPDTMPMWDERCSQHGSVPEPTDHRTMHPPCVTLGAHEDESGLPFVPRSLPKR